MKIQLGWFILILLVSNLAYGQDNLQEKLEEQAVNFFCRNVDVIEKNLSPTYSKATIKYNGKVQRKSSAYFTILLCFDEIELYQSDSITMLNTNQVDSLNRLYERPKKSSKKININSRCYLFKKKTDFEQTKSVYKLKVYQSIEIQGFHYVVLSFYNRYLKEEYTVVMQFNKDFEIVDYCSKGLIYD